MTSQEVLSKKFGGQDRADKARKEMALILTNENNPLYLLKDIDFAKRYDVSRHTIYSIRKQLNIPSRTDRLLHKLKHTKTNRFTIKELSKIFNVKYQCLYKLINERNLPIKTDTPPISYMITYQRTRKFTRLKRKKN